MMIATSCFGELWVWRLGMFSLMSFPDNYGDQTGLGTTDFEPHAYSRETNFKKWIKKKLVGSYDSRHKKFAFN